MKVILKESGLYQETTELLDLSTSGSLKTHAALASSGSLTAGTITSTGSLNGVALNASGLASLDGGVDVNGNLTVSAAGALAGATTIDASGDLTVGTITMAEFTVDGSGNTDVDGTLNVEGVPTFQAQSVHSAGATFNSAGLAACGAIAGATTIDASGDLTVGTITMAEFTVDGSGNTDVDGTLNVEGAATLQSTLGAGATTVSSLTTTGNASVSGSMHIVGDLDVAGAINSVTKTTSILEVEDINIICASGSNASAADEGGLLIGGTKLSDSVAGFTWDNGASNIQFSIAGANEALMSATAFTPSAAGGMALGSAALEWSDLFLDNGSDTSAVKFGEDQDTTLTHVHNTGLILNSSRQLQFGDSGTFICQSTNGQLDVDADVKLLLDAPTLDVEAETAINLKSDAISLGEGGAADVALTFNTDGNDGVITWKDAGSEDYFEFSDDILMSGTEKVKFGRAATMINEASSGNMMQTALTSISLASAEVKTMGNQFTVAGTGGAANGKVVINGATATYGLNLPNTGTHGDAIANSWSSYSDATLKKDIVPIENALEKVMSMKGVSYEYKSGGGRKVGFLAQDMKNVVPEVVKSMTQADDKELLCISYDQLTSVLVEAVKAQQAQIEDLKSVVVKLSDNS